MPAIKLHKRLPNLSPKEEQIVTEMLCEMYASGFENGKPKWISVKERLPECDGRYLCNVKSFAFKGSFYTTILKYDKGGFIEGYIYTDDVTHWMPLPEPPKGE